MKNVIKEITIGAIVFVICYLFGAFITNEMDASNWTTYGRAYLVVCFLCFIGIIFIHKKIN